MSDQSLEERMDDLANQLLNDADIAVNAYANGMLQQQNVDPLSLSDDHKAVLLTTARATVLPPIVQAAAAWHQAKKISNVVDAMVGLVFENAGPAFSGMGKAAENLEAIANAVSALAVESEEDEDDGH